MGEETAKVGREALEDTAAAASEALDDVAETAGAAVQDAERDAAGTADALGGATRKAPKATRKKAVAGGIAAAVVVLAIGFGIWHAQPSFCGAVCHVPMDAFTSAVLDGTHDVYGNELDETESLAMTARYHLAQENVDCLGCHTPTLGEQVDEGVKWVSGDYYVQGQNSLGQWVLNPMSTSDFAAIHGSDDGDGFCLRAGCHTDADGNDVLERSQLEALTSDLSATRNPHHVETEAREHETFDCSVCHKGHAQSVNYCTSCHSDAPVPDGWLTYSESVAKQHI